MNNYVNFSPIAAKARAVITAFRDEKVVENIIQDEQQLEKVSQLSI